MGGGRGPGRCAQAEHRHRCARRHARRVPACASASLPGRLLVHRLRAARRRARPEPVRARARRRARRCRLPVRGLEDGHVRVRPALHAGHLSTRRDWGADGVLDPQGRRGTCVARAGGGRVANRRAAGPRPARAGPLPRAQSAHARARRRRRPQRGVRRPVHDGRRVRMGRRPRRSRRCRGDIRSGHQGVGRARRAVPRRRRAGAARAGGRGRRRAGDRGCRLRGLRSRRARCARPALRQPGAQLALVVPVQDGAAPGRRPPRGPPRLPRRCPRGVRDRVRGRPPSGCS